MLADFFLVWAVLAVVILLAWMRLRTTDRRAAEGIDEALHAHGPDGASLREAA